MFWFLNDPFFMEDGDSEPRISQSLLLPIDTSITNLKAALEISVERHEALRTFYEHPGSGAPRQLVLAAHQPSITIGPVDEVQPVSIFDQPSFRCQATVDGSRVLSATLIANHIDLDGASMAMVAREVEDSLVSHSRPGDEITASRIQPIDLAELELNSDPRAKARDQRASRYFQKLRANAPRNFLPALSWKFASDDTRSVTLQDGTLLEAAESIANRCGISVPSVFHAAICNVVSDWTRTPRLLFSTAVGNRWNPNVRDYVGRIASAVDCQFELAPDDTYRAVLKRTHNSLLQSYLFANRDIGVCSMESTMVNEIAGSNLAKPIFIEYLDYLGGFENTWPPDGQPLHQREAGSTGLLWFTVSPFSNTTSLNVKSDSAVLSEEEAVEILQQLTIFMQRAANDLDRPVRQLRDRASAWGGMPETRWLELGTSRFSANRIETNIERCHGVSAAAVFTNGSGSLIAYVAGASADLVEIHEHLLFETSQDYLIKIPSLYILTAEPPAFGEREDSWEDLSVIDRFGPADDYSARVTVDERFEMLKDAFIRCNGSVEVSPTKSYAALGGSYLMISGMLELLRSNGFTGLDPRDLLSLSSMASLAKRMQRVGNGGPERR
jgi:hypothetical protein